MSLGEREPECDRSGAALQLRHGDGEREEEGSVRVRARLPLTYLLGHC